MNQLETLQQHHALCDEIHAAVLAENRFLRQHQHAPDASQTEHKRALLAQLDQSLAALRVLPAASARDPETKAQLEKTRARILQILQLDKENEQLLLRCSLSGGKRVSSEAKTAASVSMLQKIYARCS
jgi:hypothetical protein